MEKEGGEGGRWAHNALPPANTKALEPWAGQWEVGGGQAEGAPILHLLLVSQGTGQG